MATEADEAGFDPTKAHFDSTGICYARTVYDPLAVPDANGNPVNGAPVTFAVTSGSASLGSPRM